MPARPAPRSGGTTGELTFRTLPARVTGWVLVVVAVGLAVVLARTEQTMGMDPWVPVVVMLVVVTLVWVVLLRPAVRVEQGGVLLQNLFTDVWVPFGRLEQVGDRWALELVDDTGRTHSAWAVPTRREWRPRTTTDDFAEATTRGRSRGGITAQVVAGEVEHRWQRYRLEGEPGPGSRGGEVSRRWAPAALAPLVLAGIAVVVVLF